MPKPPRIRYTHEILVVGKEWYAEVSMYQLDYQPRVAELLTVLHIKHGWPVDHILIYGLSDFVCTPGGTAERLHTYYSDMKQGIIPFVAGAVQSIMRNLHGTLLGNEPLSL